jgi:hypothetical protein
MARGILNRWLDESVHRSIRIVQRYILSQLPFYVKFVESEQHDTNFNVYCYASRELFPESSDSDNSMPICSEIYYNLSMAQILSFVNETRRFLLHAIAGPEISAAKPSSEIFFFDDSLINHENYKSVLTQEYKELYAVWDTHSFYPLEPHDFFEKSVERFGNPIFIYDFREMLVPVHSFVFTHELGHICMATIPHDCASITTAVTELYDALCNESNLYSQRENQSWIEELCADAIALAFCSNINSKEYFLPISISNYVIYGAATAMLLALLNEKYFNDVLHIPVTGTHPSWKVRLQALRLVLKYRKDEIGDNFDAVCAKLDKAEQALEEISHIIEEAL